MAIGRISGPMLYQNLERQGVDLSFESNILYLDVTHRRIGANTSSPDAELQVVGTAHLGNIIIQSNVISSSTGVLIASKFANVDVVTQGNIANLNITNQTISTTVLNSDLTLAPNGIGVIRANSALISNVKDPLSNQDAATKYYVDNQLSTFSFPAIKQDNSSITVVDNGISSGNIIINVDNSNVAYFTSSLSQLGNITFNGNIISTTGSTLVIAPQNIADGNTIVKVGGVGALDIPSGTTGQRPSVPPIGSLRFNTDQQTIEWYTGAAWVSGTKSIATQTINPDGVNKTFNLSVASVAEGILVNINGTIQQPGTAYTVNPAQTQITFNEIPLTTDIIELRYIAATTVAAAYYGGEVGGDIIPSANVTYDLGSSTKRWRNLWLSNSTIFLGNTVISEVNGNLNLPVGTTINGATLSAGFPTGQYTYTITQDATVTELTSLDDISVIYCINDPAYTNNALQYLTIPNPTAPGQRLTVYNINPGQLNLQWTDPRGGYGGKTVPSGDAIEMVGIMRQAVETGNNPATDWIITSQNTW